MSKRGVPESHISDDANNVKDSSKSTTSPSSQILEPGKMQRYLQAIEQGGSLLSKECPGGEGFTKDLLAR